VTVRLLGPSGQQLLWIAPGVVIAWLHTDHGGSDAQRVRTSRDPAKPKTIGVRQLAEHLGTGPRALRAFLRRSKRAVGRGTRYEWKSLTDADAKKVIAEWRSAEEAKQETPTAS
jgi:hypothetical protein